MNLEDRVKGKGQLNQNISITSLYWSSTETVFFNFSQAQAAESHTNLVPVIQIVRCENAEGCTAMQG